MGGMLPIPSSVQAAVPGLEVNQYSEPGTSVAAYVDRRFPKRMNINTAARGDKTDSIYHEAEHQMAMQNRDHGLATNSEYDRLREGMLKLPDRRELVSRLIQAAPYLENVYGFDSAYFQPEMEKFQGPLSRNLLAEQLATISAAEQTRHVDIINDPALRHVFDTPELRDALSSLMGLRQTRLDAKDLQPYTPLSQQPSWHAPATVEQLVDKPGMLSDFKRRWAELLDGKRQYLYGDRLNKQTKPPMPFEKRQPPIIGVRG